MRGYDVNPARSIGYRLIKFPGNAHDEKALEDFCKKTIPQGKWEFFPSSKGAHFKESKTASGAKTAFAFFIPTHTSDSKI